MLSESSIEHARWFITELTEQTLPIRLERSPRENGFFHSQFDREWRPATENIATLVSQSRAIYTMSAGYAVTADERYRTAAERGIEFLELHFRDPDAPGYFYSVTSEGVTVDDTKQSYAHAFVIFAYANAASMLARNEYALCARRVWEQYREGFTHPDGGFRSITSRTFEPVDGPLSQNSLMHLFEALVSLGSIPRNEELLREAAAVADFVTGRLIDAKTGFLPELFTTSWTPIRESEGNMIDVGNAFEWAFLLSSAVREGLPKRFLSFAHQFLDTAITLGYDRERGLVFSPASLDGERVMRTNSYREQCEALRALLHFAVRREREQLTGYFDVLATFVRAHYIDSEFKGWYASVTPKGSPANTEKGSIGKLDYHQTAMALEMKRIIEPLGTLTQG